LQRELIKANANPNTDLNELNPDYVMESYYSYDVDKSDLTSWTTEFCFSSNGYYDVEAEIIPVNAEIGRPPAVKAQIKTLESIVYTTQEDFEGMEWANRNASSKMNVVSFPEPYVLSGMGPLPAQYGGYLSAPFEEPEDTPQVVFASSFLNGSVTPSKGFIEQDYHGTVDLPTREVGVLHKGKISEATELLPDGYMTSLSRFDLASVQDTPTPETLFYHLDKTALPSNNEKLTNCAFEFLIKPFFNAMRAKYLKEEVYTNNWLSQIVSVKLIPGGAITGINFVLWLGFITPKPNIIDDTYKEQHWYHITRFLRIDQNKSYYFVNNVNPFEPMEFRDSISIREQRDHLIPVGYFPSQENSTYTNLQPTHFTRIVSGVSTEIYDICNATFRYIRILRGDIKAMADYSKTVPPVSFYRRGEYNASIRIPCNGTLGPITFTAYFPNGIRERNFADLTLEATWDNGNIKYIPLDGGNVISDEYKYPLLIKDSLLEYVIEFNPPADNDGAIRTSPILDDITIRILVPPNFLSFEILDKT
jgi:hypothetical protein